MSATVLALDLLLALLNRAGEISSIIKRAKTEGRELTLEELDTVVEQNDAARADLADAIARAKAEGR